VRLKPTAIERIDNRRLRNLSGQELGKKLMAIKKLILYKALVNFNPVANPNKSPAKRIFLEGIGIFFPKLITIKNNPPRTKTLVVLSPILVPNSEI